MNYSRTTPTTTARMAPNHQHYMFNGLPLEPVSRTYQYRKIMKPMLERKRRARINKCLDELKDLMTGIPQAENVSKLEKADILELTVQHLRRLRKHNALFLHANPEAVHMEKFWAGFQHCAVEVSQFLSKYDQTMSGDLVKHIVGYIPDMAAAEADAVKALATTKAANYQRFSTPMQQALPNTLPAPLTARSATSTPTGAYGTTLAAGVRPSNSAIRMHSYEPSVPAELELYGGGNVWRPW